MLIILTYLISQKHLIIKEKDFNYGLKNYYPLKNLLKEFLRKSRSLLENMKSTFLNVF